MQTLPQREAQYTIVELSGSDDMAQTYAEVLAKVALAHSGSFSKKPFSDSDLKSVTEMAKSPYYRTIGLVGADGTILAGGNMCIQYDLTSRVATINHLFNAASAGLGIRALRYMISVASSERCDHVIGAVLGGNTALMRLYASAGSYPWYTDRQGNVWLRRDLTPGSRGKYLSPYIWAEEYDPRGF